jgi:hypothetical protein
VADVAAGLDTPGTVRNWRAANDLASTLSAAFVALPTLLLATEMLPESTTRMLVRVDFQVHGLVAHADVRSDLLRAPFVQGLLEIPCMA